ncbi:hypothetical protein IW261DRAFT_1573237 [Armillaria novae-zelandiae]|uniref:Uncharacterized protein n=1 Tax=Armillaria novae-zelandiae TaxID=153914 RepID=A0AA39NNJ5_9AGAR|nr:hypothetical protein IW261DRAFT_1573237 [Armillaria novae-zelandiae]
MFPFEELDPYLQRLLPFFDDEAAENARERDVVLAITQAHPILLTFRQELSKASNDVHAPFVRNLLKSVTRLASALTPEAYVEEWNDWALTMKESKAAMLLHPQSRRPVVAAKTKRPRETPAPSDGRRTARGKALKDPQPPVMRSGKPGPGNLKYIKVEQVLDGSRQSSSKRPPADASEAESEAPPTKKSRRGKSMSTKPKAIPAKKKPVEAAPSRSTRSQSQLSPSPVRDVAGDPPGDDEGDQDDETEILEELNTVPSGPGIGGIPVINRRLHKSFPPPSMVPGEGVYLFPTVEPEPIKKDEVRELVKDEAVPNYPCLHCASSARNVPCVFRGWGNNCDACYRGSKSVCSFKAGPLDRFQIRTQAFPYVEATATNVRRQLEQAMELRHLFDLSANTTASIASRYHAALRNVYNLIVRIGCMEAPSSLRLVMSDPDLPQHLYVALEKALTARAIEIPDLDVASLADDGLMAPPGASLSLVSPGSRHSPDNQPASPQVESPGSPRASFAGGSSRGLDDFNLEDPGFDMDDQRAADEAKEKRKKRKQRRSSIEESSEVE